MSETPGELFYNRNVSDRRPPKVDATMYSKGDYAGSIRAQMEREEHDKYLAQEAGLAHMGAHEWYDVGDDNFGGPYKVCTKEGCSAEMHPGSTDTDADGNNVVVPPKIYPEGKK
jgi:hypothetical protein